MRSRVYLLGKLLLIFGGTLFCGWLFLGWVLRALPIDSHPWLVWLNALVLAFVYGMVWMAIAVAGLPNDLWAPRGVWRLTLFNFGAVFISRKEHGKRVDATKKAGYITWSLGNNWVVCPSTPGWLMRLGRRVRAVWREE